MKYKKLVVMWTIVVLSLLTISTALENSSVPLNGSNTTTVENQTQDSLTGNIVIELPVEENESSELINETPELPMEAPIEEAINETIEEPTFFTTITELILDAFSFIRGDLVEIAAKLTYENSSPLSERPVDFYVDEEKVGTEVTNEDGLAVFFWNTSPYASGGYVIQANYSGDDGLMTSVDQETVVINEFDPITPPVIEEEFVLPTIPEEQCVPEWVELKTSCQRDSTVRGFFVDVNDCFSLTKNPAHKRAPRDTTYLCDFQITKQPLKAPSTLVSKDGSEWKILKQDYIMKYIDVDFVYLNDEYYRVDWKWNDYFVRDVLQRCSLGGNKERCLSQLSSQHGKSEFVNVYRITDSTYEEVLNGPCDDGRGVCTKEVTLNDDMSFTVEEHIFLNFTPQVFSKMYLDGEDFLQSMVDVSLINQNDVPRSVLRGSSSFLGKFNLAKRESGTFYVKLRSANPLVKIGINSLLAEFNNSKTIENLTFTGNQNITRYLDLDKGSNVSSAFLSLAGFRSLEGSYGFSNYSGVNSSYNLNDGSSEACSNLSVSVDGEYDLCVSGFTQVNCSGADEFFNQTFARFRESGSTPGTEIVSGGWRELDLLEDTSSFCANQVSGIASTSKYCFDVGQKTNGNYYACTDNNQTGKKRIRTRNYLDEYYDVIWADSSWSPTGSNDLQQYIQVYQYPINSYLEVGTVDGSYEWNWSGNFTPENGTQTTLDFADQINEYLATCTPDENNRCQVPLLFHSDTAGGIQYSNINITYHNYPRNPSLDAANDSTTNWNYAGEFVTTETTGDFSSDLQTYLNDDTLCPPSEETCLIPLVFNSTSKGILNLTNLQVQYTTYDTVNPTIHSVSVTPNPADVDQIVTILVNATDNINLTLVNASLLSQSTNLSYNVTSGLYQGTLTALQEGVYQINITASDWKNLTSINTTVFNVTNSNAELTLTENDIVFSSSPLENTLLPINVTIYNYGESDANNFIVELQVDGVSQANNTVSVGALSSNITQFNWTTIYGSHNFTINVDASEVIVESNETNNQANKSISVLDATAPIIHTIVADPVTQNNPLSLLVNTTDNVGINTVLADVNNTQIILELNTTSGLYENHTETLATAGIFPFVITTTDTNGLATSQVSSLQIYPSQADLTLTSGDVILSPLPLTDGATTNISITLHNNGGTSITNSTTEFFVNGISTQNITQGAGIEGTNTTVIFWQATYGSHNLSFRADSFNNVSEANETNNELNFTILVQDATSPTIQNVTLPASVYVSSNLRIQANVTDNVNVNTVNATISGTTISLTFNGTTGLYDGTTTAPSTSGTYQVNVSASDIFGLRSDRTELLIVNPSDADLVIGDEDVTLNPTDPEEPELLKVNVTVRNEGGTDANSFTLRFQVNGNTEDRTISVAKASSTTETFNWTSEYSNHTITITADQTSIITESNESNNQYIKEIFVLDIIPPAAPNVTASPNNWSTQTTHNISWDAVNDTNGVDHYEYQINFGDWTNIGLNTSFITPSQEDGVHTIHVRAVDIPGNLGEQGNVSIFIDNSIPNTPIVKEWHTGNSWSPHASPYYSWTNPGDVGSGVVNYVGQLNEDIIALNNTNSYHVNVTSGTHTFRIYAQDALQHNSSWSENVTVQIDLDQPSNVTITSQTHPTSNWFNLSEPLFNFTASDDHSGVAGFYYVIDANATTIPDIMNIWTKNYTINVTGLGGSASGVNGSENQTGVADGSWYLHTIAKDNVGNLGSATHYFFNIDSTPPAVLNISPSNSTVPDENPALFAVSYLDIHSGVNLSLTSLIIDGNDYTINASFNTTHLSYLHHEPFSGGQHNASLQLGDNAGNIAVYVTTFNATPIANESAGRAAIDTAVGNSSLTTYTTYTDQQIYVRYKNNTQLLDRFDTVIKSGNQTWAFNYVTLSDSYSAITSLYNNTLVIWQNDTITQPLIESQVSSLINSTVWS